MGRAVPIPAPLLPAWWGGQMSCSPPHEALGRTEVEGGGETCVTAAQRRDGEEAQGEAGGVEGVDGAASFWERGGGLAV